MIKRARRTVARTPASRVRKNRQAILLFAGGLVFLGVVFFIQYQLSRPKELDEQTLCPVSPPDKQVVILIDKSDKWDLDDIGRVDSLVTKINRSTRAKDRLTIKAIVGAGRESTEVKTFFDKCNPGNEQECNALYQNCRRIRKRYEESFEKQLDEVIEALKLPGESSYSPLLESLAQTIDDSNSKSLEVHFVSDLMENGGRFRFYDVVPMAEEISAQYPLPHKGQTTVFLQVEERRRHSRELLDAVQAVWKEYLRNQEIEVSSERLLIAD
jgi:hypothetical protein